MLHPIFEEASNIVREEFPNTQQVVFARVDCDQHCEYRRFTRKQSQRNYVSSDLLEMYKSGDCNSVTPRCIRTYAANQTELRCSIFIYSIYIFSWPLEFKCDMTCQLFYRCLFLHGGLNEKIEKNAFLTVWVFFSCSTSSGHWKENRYALILAILCHRCNIYYPHFRRRHTGKIACQLSANVQVAIFHIFCVSRHASKARKALRFFRMTY